MRALFAVLVAFLAQAVEAPESVRQSQRFVRKLAKAWTRADEKSASKTPHSVAYNGAPIGSGPYRFTSWKRGDWLDLTANARYITRFHVTLDKNNKVAFVAVL